MGDFRADIKIKMIIFGKTYKMKSWISYFPDYDGVDRRIKEFFAESFNDARERSGEMIYNSQKESRDKEIRESELKELERLKQKYENVNLENVTIEDCETIRELVYVMNEVNK